jgi:hypothetical protein
VVRLTKLLLWAYVPAALYGLFQQMYGFQEFEIAYLKTGLTLEIKQLYASEVRAFSTMNSPTAFSVVSAILCTLSLTLAFTPRREGGGTLLKKKAAFALAAVYFAAIVASTSRSAMLLVMIAWIAFLCFRSRKATSGLYTGMGVAFVGLVALSGTILSNLDAVQDKVSGMTGEGQLASQLSRVGTFSDRLRGFSNVLTNPDVYTLFGYGPSRGTDDTDPLYAHDMISNTLVAYGLVPLIAIVVVGGMVVSRMHRLIFRMHDRHHRLLAAGFLAIAFALFVLSAVSGSVFGTFPINVLLWLCFALLTLTHQSDLLRVAEVAPALAEAQMPSQAVMPRAVRRFQRSGRPSPESGS